MFSKFIYLFYGNLIAYFFISLGKLQTVQQICFVDITSLNGQIFPLNKDLCVCVCVCVCTAPRLLAFCLSLIFLRSPSLSLFLHAYFILSAFFWQVLFAFFILFFFFRHFSLIFCAFYDIILLTIYFLRRSFYATYS